MAAPSWLLGVDDNKLNAPHRSPAFEASAGAGEALVLGDRASDLLHGDPGFFKKGADDADAPVGYRQVEGVATAIVGIACKAHTETLVTPEAFCEALELESFTGRQRVRALREEDIARLIGQRSLRQLMHRFGCSLRRLCPSISCGGLAGGGIELPHLCRLLRQRGF